MLSLYLNFRQKADYKQSTLSLFSLNLKQNQDFSVSRSIFTIPQAKRHKPRLL